MEQQITRKDVEKTPFALIIDADTQQTRIAMGNQIILEDVFENEESARQYVNAITEMPWELIFNAMTMYVSFLFNNWKKTNETTEEEKGKQQC